MYPPNLYKGTVWMGGGEGKLLYIGAQDQYYTFTMFDAQALWALKWITSGTKLTSKSTMEQDIQLWTTR